MIIALEDLSEGTFTNLFDDLEAEADLIVLRNAIVAVAIIIAVIYYPFGFCGMDFKFIRSQVVHLFKLLDLCHF